MPDVQHIAIYLRVSSKTQDTRSQEPDLEKWTQAFADGTPTVIYRDSFTGRTMDRPGWKRLERQLDAGCISRIVVWRLDRLGRTASGLVSLFEKLISKRVGLTSIRDSIDLGTAAGKLMANILASIASYETEIRCERVLAGQAAARAAGKRWGGSKKGRRITVTDEQIQTIRRLQDERTPVAAIARATGLSRPTIYRIVRELEPAPLAPARECICEADRQAAGEPCDCQD